MWINFFGSGDYPTIGIVALDYEHQRIAAAFSRLFDAITAQKPLTDLKEASEGLRIFFSKNCREEEAMMLHDQFPFSEEHKMQHEKLQQQLKEFQAWIGTVDSARLLQQLCDIKNEIIRHISEEDSKLAKWHLARDKAQAATSL